MTGYGTNPTARVDPEVGVELPSAPPGRVVYMNAAAERQVKGGNALRIVNNRLVATDPQACAAITKAIDEVATDESVADPVGLYQLTRTVALDENPHLADAHKYLGKRLSVCPAVRQPTLLVSLDLAHVSRLMLALVVALAVVRRSSAKSPRPARPRSPSA